MNKQDDYRKTLRTLEDWDAYLLQESRLPGPRANLELAKVVADEGNRELFERYLAFDATGAPANTPHEFLAFCGVLGLGRLLAKGDEGVLEALRLYASDPRWRVREAVAMALQCLGEVDMDTLLAEMEQWSRGTLLEQRAAAAAVCHPNLLRKEAQAERVLQILDGITATLQEIDDRQSDEFRVLRKGLGYCWSVAVSALPAAGKPRMEAWLSSNDRDVRWIMKQNLAKKRLARMDAEWVAASQAQLDAQHR